MSDEVAQTAAQLAEGSRLALVTTEALAPGLITSSTRRLIVEAGDPAVEALAAANETVEVLLIGPGGVQRLGSGTLSGADTFELNRSFAGGYGASLLAPEWRIGGILPPEPLAAHDAFLQGGVFGCGLCNPLHPPFAEYPLIEIGATEQDSLTALEALSLQGVDAIYFGQGIATPLVAQAAAEKGMAILAADPPPQDTLQNWAGSILPDLPAALRKAWAADRNGQDSWVAPLTLQYADPGVLSPGRQDDLQRLFERLETGAVRVLVEP